MRHHLIEVFQKKLPCKLVSGALTIGSTGSNKDGASTSVCTGKGDGVMCVRECVRVGLEHAVMGLCGHIHTKSSLCREWAVVCGLRGHFLIKLLPNFECIQNNTDHYVHKNPHTHTYIQASTVIKKAQLHPCLRIRTESAFAQHNPVVVDVLGHVGSWARGC